MHTKRMVFDAWTLMHRPYCLAVVARTGLGGTEDPTSLGTDLRWLFMTSLLVGSGTQARVPR